MSHENTSSTPHLEMLEEGNSSKLHICFLCGFNEGHFVATGCCDANIHIICGQLSWEKNEICPKCNNKLIFTGKEHREWMLVPAVILILAACFIAWMFWGSA